MTHDFTCPPPGFACAESERIERIETHAQAARQAAEACDGKLARLLKTHDGNGNPPLEVRLDRSERFQAAAERVLWLVVSASVTGAVAGGISLVVTLIRQGGGR